MSIRNATYHDAPAIKGLLEILGCKVRISVVVNQLVTMFGGDDNQVFVYEMKREVVGFVCVHYLPQLMVEGGLAVITYLTVDEALKGTAIAGALEQHVTEQARLRKCERIQVDCLNWCAKVHQFYLQQGYLEYAAYFAKRPVY